MNDLRHKIDLMNVVFLFVHIMKNAVTDGIYPLKISIHSITATKRITSVSDHRKNIEMAH
jgi:hypothetical protein